MSSSDSSGSSSFFSSLASAAGAAPPAAAAGAAPPAGAAPTPDPMLVIKSRTLMPSRALAKRPGQYGSTSTLAAFRMVEIFSPVTATSSSTRMRAEYTQANSALDAILDYKTCKSPTGLSSKRTSTFDFLI
ncbi:unnamed protein product [Chrysodeixis includens]|uniref:Uncharacterized protein n=1 Tax=Chrysodeixis includens TaxID=689277 RepID=A0A9N8KYQ1_CHRIL|nr:unnamed protein product [Chrysodeixis includens]